MASIQKLSVLFIMLFYSGNASACALGFSYEFSALSKEEIVGDKNESTTHFLNRKLGVNNWLHSSGILEFSPLKQIENSAAIGLTFGSATGNFAGKYSRIELYRGAFSKLIEFTGTPAENAQQVADMFPSSVAIQSDRQIGPASTNKYAAKFELAASFKLNNQNIETLALPYVSIRVRAADNSDAFQALAVFYPENDRELPIVTATEILRIPSCSNYYVVKGAWPKALKETYDYE